ncbi:MAG: hypothetical protein AAFQ98_19380, partial [Bacteroidota bacterium]
QRRPPLANYNLMRDIESHEGDSEVPNSRRERRRRERSMNYSGNGYNAPPNRLIAEAIGDYAPDPAPAGANGAVMEGIGRYSGETAVIDPKRRLRRLGRNMNYQGELPGRSPDDKFDTPYEEGYAENIYIPGPNRDIMKAIADFAPTVANPRANGAIMEQIRRYQGDMLGIDPKERYREPGGPEGWSGNDYLSPRFNADIQKAISEFAPIYARPKANAYVMDQINDYTAYHTIRTERAQARYYQKLTRRSAAYLGEYPIVVRRRKGIDGHPTDVYRVGRAQPTQERAEKIRRFNILWNRIFKRNIQPDVFKKRQRRPRYDRGEAEWWEQLNQPNSVDPAEGGESDSGN